MPFVQREAWAARLRTLLATFPAVAVLGPRQCGKSTLVRQLARGLPARQTMTVLDLERPGDLTRLVVDPEDDLGVLQTRPGLVCIDEVQRLPTLFPVLRVLLDAPTRRARYLLLGSASPALVAGVSETLAGRVGFLDLTPFLAAEVGAGTGAVRRRHWSRGGFPPSFLARSENTAADWREGYLRTFLEQDIPALGIRVPAITLRRFWTMLAHVHGGILAMSELAVALGVSEPTVARYLDILEGTYMVRRLAPYWANVGKRLTKRPKLYLRDSGLLHALLGVASHDALRSHPKVGASWEGWVIEQVLGALTLCGERPQAYFWRTQGGAEVDLVLVLRDRLVPIEVKFGAVPQMTRGLLECRKDLRLEHGFVIHGGDASFPLRDGVWALAASLVATPDRLRDVLLAPERALGHAARPRPSSPSRRPAARRR